MLRGAMNSLDGLEGKYPNGNSLKPHAIRFFNETKNLRINRLIGVVWALSERQQHTKSNAPRPVLNDVKFSGNMTLMRMSDMYRSAIELHPEIICKNALRHNPKASPSELAELVDGSMSTLNAICSQADEHLSDDDAWHKIEHFRHSFAHSLKFPKVAQKNDWIDKSPDYSYNELYAFGDRAARISVEFRRAWTHSRGCSGSEELAEVIEAEYAEFWDGFFHNPLFQEDSEP